jgi:hypothetical protein
MPRNSPVTRAYRQAFQQFVCKTDRSLRSGPQRLFLGTSPHALILINPEIPPHERSAICGIIDEGSICAFRLVIVGSTAGRDSPHSPESLRDAYRVANATPFAAFAMIAATAIGCDT